VLSRVHLCFSCDPPAAQPLSSNWSHLPAPTPAAPSRHMPSLSPWRQLPAPHHLLLPHATCPAPAAALPCRRSIRARRLSGAAAGRLLEGPARRPARAAPGGAAEPARPAVLGELHQRNRRPPGTSRWGGGGRRRGRGRGGGPPRRPPTPPPPPPRPPAAAWAPRPPALHGTAMTRVHAGGARAAWRAGPDGAAGRIACHAGAPLAGPGDEAPPLRQRRRSAAAQHSGQRGGIAWHGGRQLPTTVGRAGCGGGGGATSSGGRSRRVGSSDARRATTPCGGRCRPARHLSSSQGRPAPRVPWQQRCSDRPGRDRGRAVGAHAA